MVALLQSVIAFAADSLERARSDFSAAFDAALQDTPVAATDDSEALRKYALYSYVQAARIQQLLEQPPAAIPSTADGQAAAFLNDFTDEPVARRLRRAWLDSLVQRERWEDFIAQYRPQSATATSRCHYLAAHIALDRTTDLAPQIVERWLTAQQLPTACEPGPQVEAFELPPDRLQG